VATDQRQQCVKVSTAKQTSESNVYISVPTDRPQTTNFYSSVLTDRPLRGMCTIQYRQIDRRQQILQFSTDRPNAQNNVYSSEPTDGPQTAMFKVQYRQTDRNQQFVNFNTEVSPQKAIFTYQYRQADRIQQCVEFSTDRQTDDSNVYSSVLTDRPHTAMCTVQY